MGIHEWSYDNDISLDLRFKVPHRDKQIALRDIKAEVELGFDTSLPSPRPNAASIGDVQTVFTDALCIECDACVDICPVDCISFVENGAEAELRLRLSAPAQRDAGPLCIGLAEDRTGDGERRRCLPALRPVCRTVPHWRVGYAALPSRCGTGGARMLQSAERVKGLQRVNDFVVKFANVNGSGSASANTLFAKSILRMGVPITPRNIFPSNIQGLPTWYEVRVSEAGHLGARGGGVDLMVAMNPQTWTQDVTSIVPGGYLFYDNTKPMPPSRFREDIVVIGVPLTEITNKAYTGLAPAAVVQEHRLSRRALGAAGNGRAGDRKLLAEQFRGRDKLVARTYRRCHGPRLGACQPGVPDRPDAAAREHGRRSHLHRG
jgi:Pyruvate/2-oxoacid:ferredoxin oxidoreductase gamma subunit